MAEYSRNYQSAYENYHYLLNNDSVVHDTDAILSYEQIMLEGYRCYLQSVETGHDAFPETGEVAYYRSLYEDYQAKCRELDQAVLNAEAQYRSLLNADELAKENKRKADKAEREAEEQADALEDLRDAATEAAVRAAAAEAAAQAAIEAATKAGLIPSSDNGDSSDSDNGDSSGADSGESSDSDNGDSSGADNGDSSGINADDSFYSLSSKYTHTRGETVQYKSESSSPTTGPTKAEINAAEQAIHIAETARDNYKAETISSIRTQILQLEASIAEKEVNVSNINKKDNLEPARIQMESAAAILDTYKNQKLLEYRQVQTDLHLCPTPTRFHTPGNGTASGRTRHG